MELPNRIEGLLFSETQTGIYFRVFNEDHGYIRAVEIDPTRLNVLYFEAVKFATDYLKGKYQLIPEEPRIVDENTLNDRDKHDYHMRFEIIKALEEALDGDLLDIGNRSKGAEINALFKSFGTTRRIFRPWYLKYVQSGLQNYSLLNQYKSVNGRKSAVSRNIQHKLGKKTVKEQGKVLDDYDYMVFDQVLKEFRNRIKSTNFTEVWIDIRQQYYNELTITGKGSARNLILKTQIPTERQARYYVDNKLDSEEKRLAKETRREARNNRRLLNGDTVKDADGPMAICECDAWDAGIIIVDSKHPNITIGKPSVYAIIDAYSKAVVTFYITFDRDNIIGLSSMMLSLLDDKSLLKKGRENPDAIWFPGSYLPAVLRTDRGPDFTSDYFEEICRRMRINRELVPGAMGSLKPNIERLWGKIDTMLRTHLYKIGKINHTYGEKPYKDAILTLDEYRRIVTEAVIAINSEPVLKYPLTGEMIAAGVDLTPKSIWEFGIKKYGEPRGIRNREQFLFDFMIEATAKVSRSGVLFEGLVYDNPEDKRLQQMRLKAKGTKVPMTIRFDPRSVDYIWYHWEDELSFRKMGLMNDTKTGMDSFAGMTYQQHAAYLNNAKMIAANARDIKDNVRTAAYLAEKVAVAEITAKKKDLPKKTNRKPSKDALANAKTEERQQTVIEKYFEPEEQMEKPEEEEKWVPVDYDTALAEFDD